MGNKLQDKARKLAELPYTVRVEKDKTIDGQEVFLATHPELVGCMAQGATTEEAVDNLKEVTQEYILSLLEDGLTVPIPMTKLTSTTQETITVEGTFTAPAPQSFLGILSEVVQPSTREQVGTAELITC
jgi:predicted RNase H-like HicB family nuclease